MQGITSLTKCSAERYGDPSLFLSLLPCCPFLCHHHALPYHRPLISTSESQINTHEAVSPNQPSLFLTDNFKGLYHDRKLPICLSLLSTATSSSPCTAPPSLPPFLCVCSYVCMWVHVHVSTCQCGGHRAMSSTFGA